MTILFGVKWLPIGLLGALTLAAPPASAQTCTPSETTVDVATLNTWGLPAPLSRKRTARFAQIREYIRHDLDVVGLQEVWNTARSLLPNTLRLPHQGDSGLAVATPHASTQPVLTPFTHARGFDGLKRKGVLYTRVGLPGGERMNVVVTHLQAGHSKAAARVRATQIDQVIDVATAADGPTLVMGDFNLYDDLDADVDSTRKVLAEGFVDGALRAGNDAPTHRSGPHRLDRIYLRGASALQADVRDTDLSDHLPVEATVTLCRP